MHQKIKIILRTPEQELFNKEVESVYLTTEAGDLMILPDHSTLSAAMSYSPIVLKDGDTTEEYLTYGGILFVYNESNEVRILVQRADAKDKVDYHGLKSYLKLVEERIQKGEDLSDIHMRFLEGERLALVQGIEASEIK